ncbi:MAG: YutD-like domain-containing protein [Bacilli bacterium]|jgi:uncharacterized protein YutD
MKEYEFNKRKYLLEKEEKGGFDLEVVKEKMTDYFNNYDYVVGDWAYGKLRLKGFYNSNNKKATKINDIKKLDKYLKEQCAYGCKYFILKKVYKK